jgi:hypothetical protein
VKYEIKHCRPSSENLMIGSASKMTGFDVERTQQIAALDIAVGREARLQKSPRGGRECVRKPPFDCEREIGFTA